MVARQLPRRPSVKRRPVLEAAPLRATYSCSLIFSVMGTRSPTSTTWNHEGFGRRIAARTLDRLLLIPDSNLRSSAEKPIAFGPLERGSVSPMDLWKRTVPAIQ